MSGSPTKKPTPASPSTAGAAAATAKPASPAKSPIKATSPMASSSSSSSSAAPAAASSTTATDTTAESAHSDYLSTLATLLDEANLAFGQRNYEHSAMLFSQVAEAYAREFGTVHPKCADVHFRYGRALLNHAIERSGILGDAGQVKNATGKREKDLLSLVDDSLIPAKDPARFHFSEDNIDGQEGAEDEDDEAQDGQGEEREQDQDQEQEEEEDEDQEEDGAPGQDQDEDIEEDDFEIAFEVLDVARVIYSEMLSGGMPLDATGLPDPTPAATPLSPTNKGKAKATSSSAPSMSAEDRATLAVKRRYAEVVATLADVSLESESFGQAVDDYSQALVLQSELYAPTDRRLAETHYKLALALEYTESPELDRALEHLHAARNVLVARRDELADLLDKEGGVEGEATLKTRAEMAEISNELLPELELKVEDVTHAIYLRDHPEEAAASSTADEAGAGKKALGDNVQVNDLSGLVKKKSAAAAPAPAPAAAPAPVTAGSPSKKRKLDEVEAEEKGKSGETSPKKAKLDA
ncbi:hypothetical protein BCR44DRAFT_34389 [Catenaria anguillulae PL171]|uniref:Tetratricopeptide SHNi-TPR domain-containing protein n=1 Tax=Catenaria anguillulae PL171 TaxID=765915 RepID=A0A1Y2HKT7_9FUNG|nr:hypothetical protein BCR44DRAFT_34389 [Catenaria anguillulae PL171]